MSFKENIQKQYVYKKDNEKWSFYDENNRPIGIEYLTIENAVDALYQYLELTSTKEVGLSK
jgi:hypothetical protein